VSTPTPTPALLATEVDYRFDPLDLHDRYPERYPVLLESAAAGTPHGRYDILFATPSQILKLDANAQLGGASRPGPTRFLMALDEWWRELRQTGSAAAGLPFRGGWILVLGYELAQQIEPHLKLSTHAELPVALAARVGAALIRDHVKTSAWIVAEPTHQAQARDFARDLAAAARPVRSSAARAPLETLEEEPEEQFLGSVESAKRYIAAGDVFQANLSREWRGTVRPGTRPNQIYRALRRTNPAPFAGLVELENFAIISSSPERLLRSDTGRIETRPIAGTRPRDTGAAEDAPTRAELLSHPKERAEHVMLIDLERNDLGRICAAGTVRVDEFMVIESYSHVHHIVSNVSGRLRDDVTPGDMIRAVFPGGTITGCPKVRCMEIIHELERRPRGFYTGAIGYLNLDGSADLNILIRSITLVGNRLSLAAGSGIVADSDPVQELAETRAKAKGLLLALQDHD
jgi:anthranilate synthase component 1